MKSSVRRAGVIGSPERCEIRHLGGGMRPGPFLAF
ncbi:hypothetical protein QFZ94_002432 [Paraburkholderia sp. JPY465]